jgi:hypothetical protein
LALFGLFALPMRLQAAGTIIYVNAGASGTGDGSSWADAYPSLADALAGAAPGLTNLTLTDVTFSGNYAFSFSGTDDLARQRT